jgi:hypothetical protein
MDLPGRLRATTLGDLLGSLHRAAATGTLELTEDRGRVHRVFLSSGLVSAVEVDGATTSLGEILRTEHGADDGVLRLSLLRAMASRRLHGEVLVADFHVSPEVIGNALRRQIVGRLLVLDRMTDARVAFRVAVRPPRGALTGTSAIGPRDFLYGRRRRRDADASHAGARTTGARTTGGAQRAPMPADPIAWRVLGLPPGSGLEDIKRAYRRLAKSLHPDLHPLATDEERADLQSRFAEVTDAYRALVA